MNNIKTFDQVNEEMFGIGRSANKNKDLVNEITSMLHDVKPDVYRDENVMKITIEVLSGRVDIEAPIEIIKAKDLVVKKDGEVVELALDQKNRIQQALKNLLPLSKPKVMDKIMDSVDNNFDIVKFSNFK